MNVVVYTKKSCPNCVTAKRLLESKGIGYTEMDAEQPPVMEWFARDYPEVTPEVAPEVVRVGGLAGLQAALKQLGV